MKLKRFHPRPTFGMHPCITTLITFLWIFSVLVTSKSFFVEATSDSRPSLRRANITTSINYDHCRTKCVTSIATGDRSGCQGFAGDDCSFPYEICPDSTTQCFGQMSFCVDDADSTSGYRCNCMIPSSIQKTFVMEDALVRDCVDRVTEVCERDQTITLYAFCTNGGQCVSKIEPGEPHPGCVCPGRFVGRHCEKRRGTGQEYRIEPAPVKVDEFNEVPIQKVVSRRLSTWMTILVVLLSSAVVAFLFYATVVYRRFLSQRGTPITGDGKAKMRFDAPAPAANENSPALKLH